MTKQIVRYMPRGQGTVRQVSNFVKSKLMRKSVDDTSLIEERAAMNDTRDTVGLDLSHVMGSCEDTRDTRMSE